LAGTTLLAVPDGPQPHLQVVNRADVDATLHLRALEGGGEQQVVLRAGESLSLPPPGATTWELDPGDAAALHAQLSMSGTSALAAFAVWPSDAAAAAVRVYP